MFWAIGGVRVWEGWMYIYGSARDKHNGNTLIPYYTLHEKHGLRTNTYKLNLFVQHSTAFDLDHPSAMRKDTLMCSNATFDVLTNYMYCTLYVQVIRSSASLHNPFNKESPEAGSVIERWLELH